ncbi:hypothetical protein BH11VER1_BH11VER1_14200 [soil metagenome]
MGIPTTLQHCPKTTSHALSHPLAAYTRWKHISWSVQLQDCPLEFTIIHLYFMGWNVFNPRVILPILVPAYFYKMPRFEMRQW